MTFQYQLYIKKIFLVIIFIQLLGGSTNTDDSNNGIPSTDSLFALEEKFFGIRQSILKNKSWDNTNTEIEMLVRLYDINKRSNVLEHQFLTQALGDIGDEKVIPLLMEIARNHDLPISVRKNSVEILSKKQAPELVDFLVEMLGDPESRDKVNDFTLNVMEDLFQERMVMALLEAYQLGRNKYFSLLNTIMNGLDNFENPKMKSVYKEIASTKNFPSNIRLKAFKSLIRYSDDPEAVDLVIELLNDPDNYVYYQEIITILKDYEIYDDYQAELRMAAFKAMQKDSNSFE